jgi:uncharacterized membrane protein
MVDASPGPCQQASSAREVLELYSMPLQLHLGSVAAAIPLGAWQLARPKGNRSHAIFGYLWVGVMAAVAVTSFGLRDEKHAEKVPQTDGNNNLGGKYRDGGKYRSDLSGVDMDVGGIPRPRGLGQYTNGEYVYGLSPVHMASAWLLVQLPRSLVAARAGDIKKHAFLMRGNMFVLSFGAYFFGLTTATGITERIRV